MRNPEAREVFINCPFDEDYRPLFYAIIFALHDCGFVSRTALEASDSSEVRIDKICRIIEECEFGIHDISRITPDKETGFPRFNMPLELGLFLGAKRYGNENQAAKSCLILATEPYQYQAYISDIAGQDIRAHSGIPLEAIRATRNWCNQFVDDLLPSPERIVQHFERALEYIEDIQTELGFTDSSLTYNDYTTLVSQWLMENPR